MIVTVSSDFHPTRARFRVDAHRALYATGHGAVVELTARQVRRAHKTLCGMSDCTCGGVYRTTPKLIVERGATDRYFLPVEE